MASGTIKAVVPKSDIVDNLTTNDGTKVLSAAQGYALNSKLTSEILNVYPATVPNMTANYRSVVRTGNVVTISINLVFSAATSGYVTVYSGLPIAKETGGLYQSIVGVGGKIALVAINHSGNLQINAYNADSFFVNISYICE